MPSHFYEKTFNVGKNGTKLSLLQLDSCYLLCDGGHSPECEDKQFVSKAKEQREWLDDVLHRQANDSSITWKATTLHHPTFGLFYPDSVQLQSTLL